MKRRQFITLLGGGAAGPLATRAEQVGRTRRIGLLTRKTDASVAAQIDAFRDGLRDLGWVEGKSVSIEFRDAGGQLERLRPLAAEFVALNVDVIVTVDTPPTQATIQATGTIPIVIAVSADPVSGPGTHEPGQPYRWWSAYWGTADLGLRRCAAPNRSF
jgi:putative ABC transport system substrate-binding protein